MRTSRRFIPPAAALAGLLCLSTAARAQEPAAPGTTIAAVDMEVLFKEYAAFNHRMNDLRGEVRAFELEIQQKQQELQDAQRLLEMLEADSPDRPNLQQRVATLAAEMQTQTTLMGEEFRLREASVYYETYQEILEVIESIAQRDGIQLVVRLSAENPDRNDPNSVLRLVNRQIVFQRDLDITDEILAILNQSVDEQLPGEPDTDVAATDATDTDVSASGDAPDAPTADPLDALPLEPHAEPAADPLDNLPVDATP